MKLTNDYDAFKLGLKLAITAPTEKNMVKTMKLVHALQNSLSKDQINSAQKEVEKELANES